MESLLALPIGVGLEVVLFLLLHNFTPIRGKQAAVVVGFMAIALALPYSLVNWPGGDVVAMYVAVFLVTAYILWIVSNVREQRRQREGISEDESWFHWGPAIIVIFFSVVVLLNGVMVVLSKQGLPDAVSDWLLPEKSGQGKVTSAFPGTVAHDYQKKEALYNDYLDQVKRQRDRGWQVRKGWLADPVAGQEGQFQIQVLAKDDAPVVGAEVTGQFLRPSDNRLDQAFALKEVDPGVYRGQLTLPEPGLWNLSLVIRRGEDLHLLQGTTEIGAPE